MSDCRAILWLGPLQVKCGLKDPHPPNTMPDIHAARFVGVEPDGTERTTLVEWPLRHIELEPKE